VAATADVELVRWLARAEGLLRFAELIHLWDRTAPTFAFAGVLKIGLDTGGAALELGDKNEERPA
jgi:hypothetical protein